MKYRFADRCGIRESANKVHRVDPSATQTPFGASALGFDFGLRPPLKMTRGGATEGRVMYRVAM